MVVLERIELSTPLCQSDVIPFHHRTVKGFIKYLAQRVNNYKSGSADKA